MLNFELEQAIELIGRNESVFPDSHGNISVYVPDLETVLIKPSGMQMRKGYLNGSRFVQASLAAYPQIEFNSPYKPSVDLRNHAEIYKHDRTIGAIVHSHSTFATIFSRLGGVPCYFTEQLDYFGGRVKCVDPGSFPAMGWANLVTPHVSKNKGAVLLHAHGTVTWGPTPLKAVELAVALEEAAKKVYYYLQMRHETLVGNQMIRTEPPELRDNAWSQRYEEEYGQR